MAVLKGTNSYVSLEEANAYFESHVDNSEWFNLAALTKERLLITSTRILDNLSWTGSAVSQSQPLAFPRVISYFDPRVGAVVSTADTPTRISSATFEMALHLHNNDGLLSETGTIADLNVGPVSLTTIKAAPLIPNSVNTIVKPLLVNQGSNAWWRAN